MKYIRSWFFLAMMMVAMSSCGIEQVDEGYRGIETRFGKLEGEPLQPGLHFYNPFTSDIDEMKVREEKAEWETVCFTQDTQQVTVQLAVTYYPRPEKIGTLFSQFGSEWADKIVYQTILGSVKDVVGQYKADDLVGKREAVRLAAEKEIKEALAARDVIVTKIDLVNLDFDDAYERAVEAKVVAIQKAAEAKNKTVQVEEEAKQTIASAKAEAEAMRIKSQALAQNKGLVQFEAVQKWDGKLPVNMIPGGAVPFLNLNAARDQAE